MGLNTTYRSPFNKFVFLVGLSALAGCSQDTLQAETAEILVVPILGPNQTELVSPSPVGIDLGRIPLYSLNEAVFEIRNVGTANLNIDSVEVESVQGGEIIIVTRPDKLTVQTVGQMKLHATPHKEDVPFTATIAMETNAGLTKSLKVNLRITGEGYFVGEPHLEVEYSGVTYPLNTECVANSSGQKVCNLSPLGFGNIPINRSGTQKVKLRNNPTMGTCLLPPKEDGSIDCTPVCVTTLAPSPELDNLGVGFIPANEGFSLVGSSNLPIYLAPRLIGCESEGNLFRGQLELLVNFEGGTVERTANSTMVLETDAPNANQVRIPLQADIRKTPVAVAKRRDCQGDITTQCNENEALHPLENVFLDGSESYDPKAPDNPDAIIKYRWEILDAPPGADSSLFSEIGTNDKIFSFFLPLAGEYTIRLHVTNAASIESGVSDTSDVTITAIPESRLHIQLVWDHPLTDQDLHLVYADLNSDSGPYHSEWDCYWNSCRTSCPQQANCNPTHWFDASEVMAGPNPRLDIDDQEGLGPENINIDEPQNGNYDIYVHHYAIGSGEESPSTLTTVRIYGDGVVRGEFRRVLEKNDLWAVGRLTWTNDGLSVKTARSDGENVVGTKKKVEFLPSDGTGVTFGDIF